MSRNMGTADRAVRALVVAPLAVVAGLVLGPLGVLPIVLYAVAGVMLATAAVGFCPLYPLVGISTCSVRGRGGAAA